MASPKPSAPIAVVTIRNENPILSLKIWNIQHFSVTKAAPKYSSSEISGPLLQRIQILCSFCSIFWESHRNTFLMSFFIPPGSTVYPSDHKSPPKNGVNVPRVFAELPARASLINSARVPRGELISLNYSHFKCKPLL